MKKLIALVVVLIFGLSMACPCLAAKDKGNGKKQGVIKSGSWMYTVLADGTAEIWLYRGNSQNVKIPEQLDGKRVTGIGEHSISMEDSIKTITIPDCLINIDKNPFFDCGSLQKIIVSPDHPTLEVIDGVLFNKIDHHLICYPCGLRNETYEIPYGIQVIDDWAFGCNLHLLSVTIPDSVTIIEAHAFDGCQNIREINIPNSVKSLGDHSFGLCKSLTSIVIPDSITTIGESVFASCYSLTDIVIPNSVTSIGYHAFGNCPALTSVTIPDSVTSIGEEAFSSCKALTSITIPDSVTSIGKTAFLDSKSLTMTVSRGSYAEQYCQDNGINFVYSD